MISFGFIHKILIYIFYIYIGRTLAVVEDFNFGDFSYENTECKFELKEMLHLTLIVMGEGRIL